VTPRTTDLESHFPKNDSDPEKGQTSQRVHAA
jgi:hypothetical protein